jgi:hypothetical protein
MNSVTRPLDASHISSLRPLWTAGKRQSSAGGNIGARPISNLRISFRCVLKTVEPPAHSMSLRSPDSSKTATASTFSAEASQIAKVAGVNAMGNYAARFHCVALVAKFQNGMNSDKLKPS